MFVCMYSCVPFVLFVAEYSQVDAHGVLARLSILDREGLCHNRRESELTMCVLFI